MLIIFFVHKLNPNIDRRPQHDQQFVIPSSYYITIPILLQQNVLSPIARNDIVLKKQFRIYIFNEKEMHFSRSTGVDGLSWT